MNNLSIRLMIIGGALVIGCASIYIFKMRHDNRIEEVSEQVIKLAAGVDIDLTSDSPEN